MSYFEENGQVADFAYVETNDTLMDGPGFAPYQRWYAAEKDRLDRLDRLNRLNSGNPNYRPYQVEEKKS
jgi:hypothetical protein